MSSAFAPILLAMTAAGLVARGDAAADLKEAVARVAKATNYTFESVFESDAPGPGGGSRDTTPVDGKVELGKTAQLERGDVVAYRLGEKLVFKNRKDDWELFDPATSAGGNGGGGGGGRGYGGGSESKEHRTLRGLVAMNFPHDLLKDFDARMKDLKVAESDGKRTISGALTDEAATELSGAKELKSSLPSKGGSKKAAGKEPIKSSGTATLVVGKDGNLERVVIETLAKNGEVAQKQKRSVTLKDWDTTKIAVPKDAAAKLGGK